MKRVPTDDMEIVITGDCRVLLSCEHGKKEEDLFPGVIYPDMNADGKIESQVAAYERAVATEVPQEFAFVDGDGALLRIAECTRTEAQVANVLLERVGSDRRWMEIAEEVN